MRGDHLHPPSRIEMNNVLAHALDHLAWLKCFLEIPHWEFGLSEYNPFDPRGYELLHELEAAGYGEVKAVQDFRDELLAAMSKEK